MKTTLLIFAALLLFGCGEQSTVSSTTPPPDPIAEELAAMPHFSSSYNHSAMVLGTFHFNRNSDASDVVGDNHMNVQSSDNQSGIEALVERLATEYQPTIVAVEFMPRYQAVFDSLYTEYREGRYDLGKNEAFQIGFRLAKRMNLPKVHCIDNRPPQPPTVAELDDWDLYGEQMGHTELWHEYDEALDAYNGYMDSLLNEMDLINYLRLINHPAAARERKNMWLTGLVNLGHGDRYVGADLTGHWYRRNTRIFVNARNLCRGEREKVFIIYGNAHKWVLDELFEGSPEFTLEQPF